MAILKFSLDYALGQDLCTGCAACVNLCPNNKYYKDKTVTLYDCSQERGRCHAYCPRTPTNLQTLRRTLFDPLDVLPEIGAYKGLYMTRATDENIRAKAQHGGTVSALVSLALDEGMIDQAVLANQNDRLLPDSETVSQRDDISGRAQSKFVVSPTVGCFNEASKGEAENIGVVATPCQALALAKMRALPYKQDQDRVKKLSLVIGLFCGWALDWRRLEEMLRDRVGDTKIKGIDIPPSKHACMEVYTEGGTVEIPIDKVNECVRENCNYCFDMTCEFADISVGSARSAEGWEVDKGWNQLIVRSALGKELLALAMRKGVLEFKEVPEGNLEKLKKASANKKRSCLNNLATKSGASDDLLYLNVEDPVVKEMARTDDQVCLPDCEVTRG
ncbi:coenzyme F420-reducing hydrogenase, beta subunit [Desulfocicer vacuolatum DSM 3385]|uniref:Coenzyme F420-reducing hydrogenase, beta subunit n=1 Tax=Desulfocicer vacuolatum DSM 3385 TaxID=1121400 RepID=A0A1W2D6A0_9BACT|nr:Coenzyme F420 hydrogenase/dehydrogenase, beta subunit C-terminal domain [Desulfocicer vacuolatum]SMC92969.1 coenzyme F420-reducing hydrogenase, beta subunit [Desulfocicer vacuolatum DSM 3385]